MKKEPIPHKHFNDAAVQLRGALANRRPGRIIGICGLPGSGKTFLRNTEVRAAVGAPESWGTGRLAVVEVMALLDLNSKFFSKGFAARSHRALMKPDLRGLFRDTDDDIQKAYFESLKAAEAAWSTSRARKNTSETEYWESVIETAIDRETQLYMVEHAQAFGTLRSGEESPDHIWNLMSVIESIGAMAILNFVPSGYRLWEGRPEVAERMDRIYIMPYDLSDPVQLNLFGVLLLGIADRYRFESPRVFEDLTIEIGISSGTCARAIETMFDKAAAEAVTDGRNKISSKDLLAAMGKAEHVEAVWEQVKLLREISKPATPERLREIHQAHLASLA